MKSIQQLLELDEKRNCAANVYKNLAKEGDITAFVSASVELDETSKARIHAIPDMIHHLRALVERCRVYEHGLEQALGSLKDMESRTAFFLKEALAGKGDCNGQDE